MPVVQSMLCAIADLPAERRVTIGAEPIEELRRLSDARLTRCPMCRAPVVLRAGTVLAPHFAHLPGAVCAHPHAEPETDEHRAGKALLALWLEACLPDAVVTLEAAIPETGQRADVLVEAQGCRVALEYQCADLAAREWRRRHALYRANGIRDLWLLGGSRLNHNDGVLRTTEMERAMLADGAPVLFLDSAGERLAAGRLARFRPPDGACPGIHVPGRLSARPLASLGFPWPLLDWPARASVAPAPRAAASPEPPALRATDAHADNDARLLRWLRLRHGVREEALPALFGMRVESARAFGCSERLWQACVYYRWIHGRAGEAWRLDEVNLWARSRLPVAIPTGRLVLRALEEYARLLSAAGLLSPPDGKGRPRVLADLPALGRPPDPAEVRRIAEYRRTLRRDEG